MQTQIYIPYSGKIWRICLRTYWRVLNLATTDTDRIRIKHAILQCLAISANSPIRQIKNLAKFSRYTVARETIVGLLPTVDQVTSLHEP